MAQSNLSSGLAKTILHGTVKGKRKKGDRRRSGKIILRSGQEWTLLVQLGRPRAGIVVKSSLVSRRPCKVMGYNRGLENIYRIKTYMHLHESLIAHILVYSIFQNRQIIAIEDLPQADCSFSYMVSRDTLYI